MALQRIFVFALVLPALGLVGCGSDGPHGLESQLVGLDGAEALALANEWRATEPTVGTRLTADAVEFTLPGGTQVLVPLPAETMVLAVAPYVDSTHECEIHAVSGCTGEMAGVTMWVHAETADGTVLIDETMTAMENGFVELWLPRDSEIDLTIVGEGLAATQRVTTYATSKTCIADMRLE